VVFAPAPELTVTVERINHRDELHLHAGGQGFWLARMLVTLGIDTTLCGSFGGETGQVVRRLVEEAGVRVAAVHVTAANGGYVHDRRGGERREIAVQAATPLSRHDLDDLYSAALAAGLNARVCLLGGPNPSAPPVPADLYGRLARDLRANGTLVVADLSGEPRAAALDGGLDVLKTSDEDLADDGALPPHASGADVRAAMERLAGTGAGAPRVIVTRGADHPTLVLDGDEVVAVAAPQVQAVDHTGAGDSLTAGVAAGLTRGQPFRDALRLGAAAATLNVTRHGLASGEADAIEAIARSIRVEPAHLEASR